MRKDSFIRMDFHVQRGNQSVLTANYGQIKRLFSHSLYPGGPSNIVLDVDWYDNKGTHAISKCPLVSKTNDDPASFTRLAFLKECYPRPLALWPNDPFNQLDEEDPASYYFQVIDRNETSA